MQHILKTPAFGRGLFLCLTIVFSSLASIVWSCDLADHSWQGALKEVKIEGPILTFAETGLCSNFLNSKKTEKIQLSLKQQRFLWLHLLIKKLHNSWVNKLPHVFFSRTDNINNSLKPTVDSPIIGYKDYKLRIGYFADENSRQSQGKQLVLMQEGKLGIFSRQQDSPDLKSFLARSYIAVKFWGFPSPATLITITVYPVNGHEYVVFNNDELADLLLKNGLLKLRHEATSGLEIEELFSR